MCLPQNVSFYPIIFLYCLLAIWIPILFQAVPWNEWYLVYASGSQPDYTVESPVQLRIV